MTENADLAGEPDSRAPRDPTTSSDTAPGNSPAGPTRVPRLAVWAWSFVGVVAATIIVVVALAAVSEIVLPLTLAAVLAVIFKPAVAVLQRHKLKPALAAGLIVLGLLALMAGVVVATVRGVTEQADQIGTVTDAALDKAAEQLDTLGVDAAALVLQ